MVAIVFPVGSHPGRRGHESAGRLINCFAEPLGEGAPAAAVIKSVPGCRFFSNEQSTALHTPEGYRGAAYFNGVLFVAFEELLVAVDAVGVVTEIGVLEGTLPVTFARNNKSPTPDFTVLTEIGWFKFTATPGSIVEIVDADLPQPVSVCFQDGYFFLPTADGRCFASGLNATTIAALDVTTAEAKPDALIRGVSHSQHLVLFGAESTELYRNTGNATGFPFSRVTVIDRGLIGLRAVTGHEDGFGKALAWVGDDNAVHSLQGYQAVRISTPDIDRMIEDVAVKSTIEMLSYIEGGHAFVVVSADDWSWEYDLTTEEWHERKSYNRQRWRATGNAVKAFGKWLAGDIASGRMLELTSATRREVEDPLIMTVESVPGKTFPLSMFVPRADFEFDPGTGSAPGLDPIESDPSVSISWSDDGGIAWGNPLIRKVGRQGTSPRVFATRLGRTKVQGRRWRLAMADPVYYGLTAGDMTVEKRA